VAVIRFFRTRATEEDLWHRVIAPAASVLLLGGVLYLVCWKMSLLTGLSATGNVLINLPLAIAFCAGVARALVLRSGRRAAYESLGQTIPSGEAA
jgi:hypothetical protein